MTYKENDHNLEITCPIWSKDYKLFTAIVNQGIDARLTAFTKSSFRLDGDRAVFDFHSSEVEILLRRLVEMEEIMVEGYPWHEIYPQSEQELADEWINDILTYHYDIEE